MKKLTAISLFTIALNASAGWGSAPWSNNGPWNNNGFIGHNPHDMFSPDWFKEEMDDMADEFDDDNNSGPWGNRWNNRGPWGNNWNNNGPWGNNRGPWTNNRWNNSPWGYNNWNNRAPWGYNRTWNRPMPTNTAKPATVKTNKNKGK